jgi:acyl-CoA synthetase (AMP-forming)/AMP-acid ligase II
MDTTLPATLAHHAETIPDQRFTRFLKGGAEAKSRTFAEAWEAATQWAALFAERGLVHADRIIIALPNSDAFVGAYYGALITGCVPAPIAPLRRLEESDPYLQIVNDRTRFIGAKAIVVSDEQLQITNYQLLKEISILSESRLAPACRLTAIASTPDDLALIQFTSGTLGHPKAVMLSQRALVTQVQLLRDRLELFDRFKERGVSWLPLFHDMGLIGFLLTPGYAGGEINLMPPEDFVLRPTLWLKALTEFRATITGGPPSAFALCAKRVKDSDMGQYDLSSLRVALVGAEMVTRESLAAFAEKFSPAGFRASALIPTYGLAENCLAVTMPPLESTPAFDIIDAVALADGRAVPVRDGSPASARWFASVGAPLPGVSIRIVDESGNDLPERQIGEIIVQSDCVMEGYFGNEADTQAAIRARWLYTGDLGYLAGGNLHITGRKKEVIIVGGRSYYPDDVEQVVSGVAGVRMDRAVAVGIEDVELATEKLIVLAETERAEAAEREALKLNIRHALIDAGYPVGDVVLLRPKSIQSTLTGKLKRMDCKARYLAGEFDNGLNNG